MMNKFLTPKYFLSLGGVALCLLVGFSFNSRSLNESQSQLYNANSGLNICFQRITQSFTALMIRDSRSSYLTKEFRNSTGECLQQLSTALAGVEISATNAIEKTINNLKSDLHWFDKKIDRVNEMASNGEIDIYQSNITRKYSELEGLKAELEESIIGEIQAQSQSRTLSFAGTILGVVGLILAGVAFFFERKIKQTQKIELERIVESESSVDSPFLMNQIRATMVNNNLEKTANYLISVIDDLNIKVNEISKQVVESNLYKEDSYDLTHTVSELEKVETVENRPVSDFSGALNLILDRVQDKAFNKGIILDTNLSDEFNVYSEEETLQQLLAALVDYSLDQASEQSNELKKVQLRSKPLGGIAYCKTIIDNHNFSEDEMAMMNGAMPTPDMSLNLILLKEMCKDSGASIALRNKQNSTQGTKSAELELIFDRAVEASSEKDAQTDIVKIVKGKKSDLLKQFKEGLV